MAAVQTVLREGCLCHWTLYVTELGLQTVSTHLTALLPLFARWILFTVQRECLVFSNSWLRQNGLWVGCVLCLQGLWLVTVMTASAPPTPCRSKETELLIQTGVTKHSQVGTKVCGKKKAWNCICCSVTGAMKCRTVNGLQFVRSWGGKIGSKQRGRVYDQWWQKQNKLRTKFQLRQNEIHYFHLNLLTDIYWLLFKKEVVCCYSISVKSWQTLFLKCWRTFSLDSLWLKKWLRL